MFIYWVAILVLGGPVKTVALDNSGVFFTNLGAVSLQYDGSIMVSNMHQAMHFSPEGALILAMGKKGDGPGELSYLSGALWNGQVYILRDGGSMSLLFFDPKGAFLSKDSYPYRDLTLLPSGLIGLDMEPLFKKKPWTHSLVPLKLQEKAVIINGAHFHQIPPIYAGHRYNFKLFPMTQVDEQIFVMGQLLPTVTVYNPSFQLQGQFNLALDQYFPPSQSLPASPDRRILEDYVNGISLIQTLHTCGDHLVVSYGAFNKGKEHLVQCFDVTGKKLGGILDHSGRYIGSHDNQHYYIRSVESDDYRYSIDIWEDRHVATVD